MCKYGVGQGQWPRMTFKGSRWNVTGRIWSRSDLNHAHLLSPFESMTTSYVAENAISVKNRSDVVRRMTSKLCDLTWLDPVKIVSPKVEQSPLAMQNFSEIRLVLWKPLKKKSFDLGASPHPVPAKFKLRSARNECICTYQNRTKKLAPISR